MVKKNVHSHHCLRKMVKNTRTRINFSKFLCKISFFDMSYFLSTLHGPRMKGIDPGIIIQCYFSFLFHQRALIIIITLFI